MVQISMLYTFHVFCGFDIKKGQNCKDQASQRKVMLGKAD